MINNTFEELRLSGDLPSPSGVGMKILELTQGEDFSTEEIGQTIMADSALTGRLLKLANSAQAGALEHIASVEDATVRLGISTVRNVALGLSLISSNRSGKCESFEYDKYWSHSIARAVAAQVLSAHLKIGKPTEAYICALLSEIGYLALASVYPEEYSAVFSQRKSDDTNALVAMERKQFQIDHREIGALMLSEWGLPEGFSEAVREYEDMRVKADKASALHSMTDLLGAAHLIADVLTAGDETTANEWRSMSSQFDNLQARSEIEREEFISIANAIGAEWREWGSTLDIPTQRLPDCSKLESYAETAKHQDGDAPVATAEVVVEEEEESAGMRILIVDDDAMVLRLLEKVLTKDGHHVTTAKSGSEALRLALQVNPQIVLSDWMMPQMDGIELCKALRRIEHGRNMYFLLFSGRDDEKRVVEAFDCGVDDFVQKPFNERLLLARLKGGQRIVRLQEQVEDHKKRVRTQAAELGMMNRKLRAVALTDVLTQLPNRRYAMKRLEQQWSVAVRGDRPLSVIMLDIDHFKRVNDDYGHDVGDIVLKETSRAMKASTRDEEEPCRLGGEEFLVICGNTSKSQAAAAAERMRSALERNVIKDGGFNRAVTVSLGVAELTPGMDSIDALLKAADLAVYEAKEGGRNRVCIFEEPKQQAAKKSA